MQGAVDLQSLKDPLQRASVEKQIEEFGCTPKQLFRAPHPARSALPTPTAAVEQKLVVGIAFKRTTSLNLKLLVAGYSKRSLVVRL